MRAWRQELEHVRRAFGLVLPPVRPVQKALRLLVWAVSSFPLVGASITGWATHSPGWGLAVLFGGLFVLTFVSLVLRERHAVSILAKRRVISQCMDAGERAIDGLRLGAIRVRHAREDLEAGRGSIESLEDAFKKRQKLGKIAWKIRSQSEKALSAVFDSDFVTLYRTHAGVTTTRLREAGLEQFDGEAWDEAALRIEWLGLRLERLMDGQ
jgi:hypothetical protein